MFTMFYHEVEWKWWVSPEKVKVYMMGCQWHWVQCCMLTSGIVLDLTQTSTVIIPTNTTQHQTFMGMQSDNGITYNIGTLRGL